MKVLVIEDERKIALAISTGLSQEHITCDTAFDGEKGFDLASEDGYDVLIIDRLLPAMDGITLTKKLRGQGKHTPILMLTAKGQVQDKVEGLESGADDYLTKPFAFEELLARIKALARRPKEVARHILTCDSLVVDTKTFSVQRNGSSISLSAKEYALLEYLMKHQRTILKKEQIITHVWNYDANILPNTVEVFIANIRNKIDKAFPKEKKLIHTVRGFGYKLEA